ncbi:MAG: tRNA 2-thiouridine(34) synthase MnmA [Candidatus Omnitrophica bacterium]|nr:tRNA 2-thiouridine(34) synthase MnmA [Candidatus Omnitrophota bacterium]
MKKERVVVAMSGGVDSSVAAALLQKEGYEAIGMTMCFNLADTGRRKSGCCGLQGIEDARRVAHKLGIRHYVINMQKPLRDFIIKDFCKEYLRGRTPNPCVRCNQFLKFDILLKKALELDARYLATGHYVRKIRTPRGFKLKKAKDPDKDQSYFLYRLNQYQLRHALFPLGDYTKTEVRELARKFGLAVAEKPGSQEICFLPDSDYRGFLKNRVKKKLQPGPIVDKDGDLLGRHRGVAFYTVGQREGLGLALGYPAYISRIDAAKNQIVVGRREEAMEKAFLVSQLNLISAPHKKKVAARVRIRYNHKEAPADIFFWGRRAKVIFREPQFAVTPGQSAVFYRRGTVLGGGAIEEVLD